MHKTNLVLHYVSLKKVKRLVFLTSTTIKKTVYISFRISLLSALCFFLFNFKVVEQKNIFCKYSF